MKNLIIILILALFFVQCGKKKDNGLGLGILLLAGGGDSSSSSSDNATKSVTPKPGGGNGGDDPNNVPEFDEVKQKIEKNIKFSAVNENEVLSNDFNADFSITGDFFQELGKLEKLSLEHSVSAGSKKTNPTKIDITKKFLTDQKIPLTLDLSSIQPDNGFAQPKLKLKFSSNDKQIIQKEWTQNLFLQGKKQIPSLSYTNAANREVSFSKRFAYDTLNDPVPVQVSIPNDLGLSDQFETRIEAINLDWTSGAHNNTWSPTLTAPTQADGAQTSKNLSFIRGNSVTLASQLFYRLKANRVWKPTPTFTDYYLLTAPNKTQMQVNSFFFKKGEKLVLRFTIPKGYDNAKLAQISFSMFYKDGSPVIIYLIRPSTGKLVLNPDVGVSALREKYF